MFLKMALCLGNQHLSIFISHCTNDDQFVNQLRTELQLRGFETWVDHFDVPPGSHWEKVVDQALSKCHTLIVIFSQAATESLNVRVEWMEFHTKSKLIIPIKIENCVIPLLLRYHHRVDFFDAKLATKDQYENLIQQLTKALPAPTKSSRVFVPPFITTDPQRTRAVSDRAEQQIMFADTGTKITIQRNRFDLQKDEILFEYINHNTQQIYQFDKPLVIGHFRGDLAIRPDIDLAEYDASTNAISRQHAMISKSTMGIVITDLGSTNGTFLGNAAPENRLAPRKPVPLANKSIVCIGPLTIRVEFVAQTSELA